MQHFCDYTVLALCVEVVTPGPSVQVFRQRFVNLTREACNYLGSHYHDITEQLLRTVDQLIAQFECPRVYADVELVRGRGKRSA